MQICSIALHFDAFMRFQRIDRFLPRHSIPEALDMTPALIMIIAMLSTFGLIASDIYLPAMPDMSVDLAISERLMPVTISVYLFALAVAQLGYGPLADRYGRKPVLVTGILTYVIASIGCAAISNVDALFVCRFLQGVGAASGLVIGRAIIADLCDKTASAHAYAIVYPLVSLSPALAPAIGGHLAAIWGWRADFLFVAAFGLSALVLVLVLLPETVPKQVNSVRAVGAMLSGFTRVLAERGFRRYALIVCALYSAWFVYLTQSPFLFHREGWSVSESGWLYLPLSACIIGSNLVTKKLLGRIPYDLIAGAGIASFLAGGLSFIGFSLIGTINVWTIVLPMCLISLANGSSLPLTVSGAIASDHGHPATASSLVGFFQIGSAALVALIVSAVFGTSYSVLAGSVTILAGIAAWVILIRT